MDLTVMSTDDARGPVHLRRARFWIGVFIAGLVLSGLTAFPLQYETTLLRRIVEGSSWLQAVPGLREWVVRVQEGLADTYRDYPFIAYGTDWLAFAHLVIALVFVAPWRDPIRHRWVIGFGFAACALVLPLALICGPIRGIPWGWRLIDCSFGLFGAVPLGLAWRNTREL